MATGPEAGRNERVSVGGGEGLDEFGRPVRKGSEEVEDTSRRGEPVVRRASSTVAPEVNAICTSSLSVLVWEGG